MSDMSEWYAIHRVRKRSGGWREILVPDRDLRSWVRQHGLSRCAAEAVSCMAGWAGVGHVAHGFHLGRSPITLVRDLIGGGVSPGSYLVEYDLMDAFASVARPLAPYLGRYGDLRAPWVRGWPQYLRCWWWDVLSWDPSPAAIPAGWPDEPETWGIPHVVRGGYIRVGGGRYLDLVTGLERDQDGRPAKIWQGAPLAPYAYERYMIPLDVMVGRRVVYCEARYRRYADNLFFVVDRSHVDHVTGVVEEVLGRLGLGYRRKRACPIGRYRVVILGLSVDPASGNLRLAKRTRRRLRALAHAERKGPLPWHLRRVLQGLCALAAGVAASQVAQR